MQNERDASVLDIFKGIVVLLEGLINSKVNVTRNEDGSIIYARTTNQGVIIVLSTDFSEIQCNYEFPVTCTKFEEKHALLQHKSRPSGIIPEQLVKGLNILEYVKSIAAFLNELNS